MQILQQGRIVQDDAVDEILRIMSNDQAMKILRQTCDCPKSAWQISQTSDIALTQVYRWVRRLHKVGFLRISGDTNESGKKFFMYQSKINSIRVVLNSTPETIIEFS
ncbi:MAG: ArsR family transcriptional regulator [Thaumarchaeota archaeon]|nr:ArsR family transcriptional regulator [Nitrososphaerota archaeon]